MTFKPAIRFLFPNRATLAVFAVFLLIAYAGSIQAWGFCKDCGIPKPFLYDLLGPIPFWPLLMILQVPLFALSSLVALIAGQNPDLDVLSQLPGSAQLVAQGIYFYLIACLIGLLWQRLRRPGNPLWKNSLALALLIAGSLYAVASGFALIFAPLGLIIGHENAAQWFFWMTDVFTTVGILLLIILLIRRLTKRTTSTSPAGRR